MTWFDTVINRDNETNGDLLLKELEKLNNNLEELKKLNDVKVPIMVRAMYQLSLKIERHIKLGPR